MPLIQLPFNFEPRDYQVPILDALDSGIKRAIWVLHRRAGKDLTIWNWVIKTLATKKKTCFYIFPTYSQAKKVTWKMFKEYLAPLLEDDLVKYNESELKITFYN